MLDHGREPEDEARYVLVRSSNPRAYLARKPTDTPRHATTMASVLVLATVDL